MGDLFETLLGGAGWGIGVGVAIGAVSVVGRGLRPVVKEALKAGMAAGDRLQGWTAEAREQFDDIVAEAKAERSPEISDVTAAHSSEGMSGGKRHTVSGEA